MAEENSKLKAVGAGSILGTISIGFIWNIYASLDTRIRANEVDVRSDKVILQIVKEDVKEIKDDVKYIREKMK